MIKNIRIESPIESSSFAIEFVLSMMLQYINSIGCKGNANLFNVIKKHYCWTINENFKF